MKSESAAYLIVRNILFATVIAAMLMGCATAGQKQASLAKQEAYTAALTRGINAHVYEMSCQAVLPVAEELLIKRGYKTNVYDQDGAMIEMQWKDDGGATRSRYVAQGMPLGEQRCNLQIVAEKDASGHRTVQRSEEIEMELLSRIKPEIANNIKSQAKAVSEKAYQESLQQTSDKEPGFREVNDEADTDILPEQL